MNSVFTSSRSAWFLTLTFALTGLLQAALLVWVDGDLTSPPEGQIAKVGVPILLVGMMFIPGLVAVIVHKGIEGRPLRELGVTVSLNGWWLAAVAVPAVAIALTLSGSALLPDVQLSSPLPNLIEQVEGALPPEQASAAVAELEAMGGWLLGALYVGIGLAAGPTINALPAFGEELGWRGFLQKEWAGAGFWTSSAAIGIVWGLWHAPVVAAGYNYPDAPVWGPVLMTLFCLLLSPLHAYAVVKGASVFPAAMMHGTVNALAGFSLLFLQGGSHLLTSLLGGVGFASLCLLNVAVYVHQQSDRDGFEADWTTFSSPSHEESTASRAESAEANVDLPPS